MKENRYTEQLLHMAAKGTSPYMVVEEAAGQLEKAGFTRLEFHKDWGLNLGGRYYVNHHGSSLFAFTIGSRFAFRDNFRIAAAHTDFPCLRIKPNPDLETKGYSQVNVEIYGGPILNTWLDRPLSAAGRVVLKSDSVFKPRECLVDLKKPMFIIPNLAIHLNRDVNKGIELNKQTDMLPICGLTEDGADNRRFISCLARELQAEPEDILDYELYLYNLDEPCRLGLNGEFISAPRLDNLTSVQALLSAITEGERPEGINLVALFDHEEIGSHTKQGADSSILSFLMEKIVLCFGRDRAKFLSIAADSFMLSADVAHGVHPNKAGKSDITNLPLLGKGVCIKEACAQTYATDSAAIGAVEQLCLKNDIPCQINVNRSDIRGGSTIGAIAAGYLPMKTVDVGAPVLAMHSARELMGAADQEYLTRLVTAFFI